MYTRYLKRAIDYALSFMAQLILPPILLEFIVVGALNIKENYSLM